MHKLIISELDNIRIDKYLSETIIDLNRSDIGRLFDKNQVMVNSNIVKPSYKLKIGDSIELNYNLAVYDPKIKLDIPIIYEDDNVIVIDKPSGILSHSKGKENLEPTVETFIHDKVVENDYFRAGIVHRLDRATSGVMICAKTRASYKFLQSQFSLRKVAKTYFAIVEGSFNVKSAIIDLPIMRDQKNKSRFRVDSRGKNAITKYTVISENLKYSLLELEPKTGRTHQLRVHLRYLKHPIVGDTFYEGETADRLYLHAAKLVIKLSDGQIKTFISEIPESFAEKMKYN
jgi:23S rRNA pseudouridine1911/1915/1917 synthase